MNATQLKVDDDNNTLKKVAETMKVGGRVSRDRFLFVVNKLDNYAKQLGDSVEQSLGSLREYLQRHGIENPNIFPVAALPALNIRLMTGGGATPRLQRDARHALETLNEEEMLHLEKYAPLPPSLRAEVARRLEEARRNNDEAGEALIHTGLISLELAIRQYAQKYAKTAKINNLVKTFERRLEKAKTFENLQREIAALNAAEPTSREARLIQAKTATITDLVKTTTDLLKTLERSMENAANTLKKLQKEIAAMDLVEPTSREAWLKNVRTRMGRILEI
jgi:hypothetical protein